MAQPLGDEEELQGEQRADQQTGAQGAIAQGERLAAPEHEQRHQHGGDPRAQPDLQQRRHVRRSQLDPDLLQSPDAAQQHHQLQGERIHALACGRHRKLLKKRQTAGRQPRAGISQTEGPDTVSASGLAAAAAAAPAYGRGQ
ncbi:hypothetical protein D3C78_1395310 [compost metagenome]